MAYMLKKALVILGLLLGLQSGLVHAGAVNLATVQADLYGDGVKETVELYGEQLVPGSGYYQQLVLMVKDAEGKLQTAYNPDLRGGYNCLLEVVPGREKQQEILLTAAQGVAGDEIACRMYDFSTRAQVQTSFTAAQNLGVVTDAAYLDGKFYKLSYQIDGASRLALREIPEGTGDALQIFRGDGTVKKPYLHPFISNLTSLTLADKKLYTLQNITGADRRSLLGLVGTVWQRDAAGWKAEAVTLKSQDLTEQEKLEAAKVNVNAGSKKWQLYARGYWQDNTDVCYPVVAVAEAPAVQNKINSSLEAWSSTAKPLEDRAYRVHFAGPNLLSLTLYKENAQGEIEKKHFNFNMHTGGDISVKAMFNTKDKDFLPLLNLIGTPAGTAVTLPDSWYYNGRMFVFALPEEQVRQSTQVQKRVVGAKPLPKQKKELAVEAADLYKFVLDRTLPRTK